MASFLARTYRKIRYGEPIVVVSGLPRSGTSMAMKMLEAGGVKVFVDGVRTADVDNPKGYFEYERVKDLAREEDKSWVAGARGQAIKVISYLLKELPPEHHYRVIFMRRNLEEVIASQNKMLERRGEPIDGDDARTRELLENQLWRARYLLKQTPNFDWVEIDYARALAEPRWAAEQIRELLGDELDVERMAGVVDKSLYRNRAEPAAG